MDGRTDGRMDGWMGRWMEIGVGLVGWLVD